MKFETKRELEWYIQGLRDARTTTRNYLSLEIERYKSSFNHMDFDKDGVVLNSSVQPKSNVAKKGIEALNRLRSR